MHRTHYPVIDLTATGNNILRLRRKNGYTVSMLQNEFGFNNPQTIYKWQKGHSMPTIDNLVMLSMLFDVTINDIIIIKKNDAERAGKGQLSLDDCSFLYHKKRSPAV